MSRISKHGNHSSLIAIWPKHESILAFSLSLRVKSIECCRQGQARVIYKKKSSSSSNKNAKLHHRRKNHGICNIRMNDRPQVVAYHTKEENEYETHNNGKKIRRYFLNCKSYRKQIIDCTLRVCVFFSFEILLRGRWQRTCLS